VSDYSVILDQARASIAAGRTPDWVVLESRVKAISPNDPTLERLALTQLQTLAALARARSRLTPPEPRAAPARRPPALRERPTITSNMEVRRERDGEGFVLRWELAPAVLRWEVRISEREGTRYAVREELELPGDATSLELTFGGAAVRVHLLGRGRGDRLVRRAVMSSLSPESWGERWQRRASAS
jgi:hypothetical protein